MSAVLCSFVAVLALAHGAAINTSKPITPVVSGTPQVVAVVEDPTINRDSCTSTRVGSRELWTCRDSQSYPGAHNGFFYGSTASWTNFNANGTPAIANGNLTCYGTNKGAYFAPAADECPSSPGGGCSNNTRWLLWPDSPPLPVPKANGSVSLYTWIKRVYISTAAGFPLLISNPPTSLYRSDYQTTLTTNALPPVTLVGESFYPGGRVPYGDYGWVVKDDTAYLYGSLNATNARNGIALARVKLSHIEDLEKYQYYYPATKTWNSTAPSIADGRQAVPNAGTGQQGTFYYSDYFKSFVWIGSPNYGDNSVFQITTAPAPEGPWATPKTFYTAPAGSKFNGYSQQAHPGLSSLQGNGKDIYLSYTRLDTYYSTPLIHVQWQ